MLNLSSRQLSDDDYILLGKGLKFCPKTKSHDKVKLSEDIFKFTRRVLLKEYFTNLNSDESTDLDNNTFDNSDAYKDMPFFNKVQSTFTPPAGRDIYLDFYITAVTEEILQSTNNKQRFSNISKAELQSLQSLSQDKTIVIKKADKSNTIVIMNIDDYKNEIMRQLNDTQYYEKLESDPLTTVNRKLSDCINQLECNSKGV